MNCGSPQLIISKSTVHSCITASCTVFAQRLRRLRPRARCLHVRASNSPRSRPNPTWGWVWTRPGMGRDASRSNIEVDAVTSKSNVRPSPTWGWAWMHPDLTSSQARTWPSPTWRERKKLKFFKTQTQYILKKILKKEYKKIKKY